MYTRKPKDITKFLLGGTDSSQTLHTWEYADKVRRGQMGSSAVLSASARKKRELNRKTVGEYRTSQVASVATTMRGEVAKFTQNERQKVKARFEPNPTINTPKAAPSVPLQERPMPDASLYRRPSV